jgi:glutathione-specific gamma-glutamylcyclotransferase
MVDQRLMVRDPAVLLQPLLQRLACREPVWIFGYASLLWRPEFEAAEHRSARVHGWHRALRMRSRVNRGSPEQPGLVFALLPGGSCQGMVFKLRPDTAQADFRRLWDREMPTGVYDPRWLPCRTTQGTVAALAFTLSRRSPNHTGRLADEHLGHILRHATGRYGSTLDYLVDTARELRRRGIVDKEVERLVSLAQQLGLHTPD